MAFRQYLLQCRAVTELQNFDSTAISYKNPIHGANTHNTTLQLNLTCPGQHQGAVFARLTAFYFLFFFTQELFSHG